MCRSIPVALWLLLLAPVLTIASATSNNLNDQDTGSFVLKLSFRQIETGLNTGRLDLIDVRRAGLEVFTHLFTREEGYGDGPFDWSETPLHVPGHRPTLQTRKPMYTGTSISLRSGLCPLPTAASMSRCSRT